MIRFYLVLGVLVTAQLASAADRPNILFIFTDDQSHRTVSCYPESYSWVHTPNIDALAAQGVRFTHTYMGTWCASRATMLTGRHQFGRVMRMEGVYPEAFTIRQCPWPKVFRQRLHHSSDRKVAYRDR